MRSRGGRGGEDEEKKMYSVNESMFIEGGFGDGVGVGGGEMDGFERLRRYSVIGNDH